MDGITAPMLGERNRGAAQLKLSICHAVPERMQARVREITCVYTQPAHRNKLAASALMDQVCAEADKEGLVLVLVPKPYGEQGRTQEQLEHWYASLGFDLIQSDPPLMARQPQPA